ncbi:MAG: twin-arginine translocation signal domain-containing protein [Desulfocapsaceae bacterium]|nr:twin-arginine translocation signal domain-containing protein [Desulfocapsaceae bacterium]
MQKDKDKRRSFLKHVLAGAAVVVGGAAAIKPVKAKPVSQTRENDDILYHESESFKKYYDSLK